MSRTEQDFLRALGDIPQEYIDELTAWQQSHQPLSGSVPKRSGGILHEVQSGKEQIRMTKSEKTVSQHKNRETAFSVQRIKPLTVGIFASLAACAVIAVGIGASLAGKPETSQPAFTPESAASESVTESTTVSEPEAGAETSETTADPLEGALPDQLHPTIGCRRGKGMCNQPIPGLEGAAAVIYHSAEECEDNPFYTHFRQYLKQGSSILMLQVPTAAHTGEALLKGVLETPDHKLIFDIALYQNDNMTNVNPFPEYAVFWYEMLPDIYSCNYEVQVHPYTYASAYSAFDADDTAEWTERVAADPLYQAFDLHRLMFSSETSGDSVMLNREPMDSGALHPEQTFVMQCDEAPAQTEYAALLRDGAQLQGDVIPMQLLERINGIAADNPDKDVLVMMAENDRPDEACVFGTAWLDAEGALHTELAKRYDADRTAPEGRGTVVEVLVLEKGSLSAAPERITIHDTIIGISADDRSFDIHRTPLFEYATKPMEIRLPQG
ncbi:MAG: hypothetical protein IKI77_02315 [Oscillospiraceae bacterium]|nr:hypothetical protein [Oscillospiraceae bacterium]